MFDKVHNPETGRMVKTNSKKGKELLKKYASGAYKTIRNPVTGKNVMTGGALGKKLLKRFAGGGESTFGVKGPSKPDLNQPMYNLIQFSKKKAFEDINTALQTHLKSLPRYLWEKHLNIDKNKITLENLNEFIIYIKSKKLNNPKSCTDYIQNHCQGPELYNLLHNLSDENISEPRRIQVLNKEIPKISDDKLHLALDSMFMFLHNTWNDYIKQKFDAISKQIEENNSKFLYYLKHYYYTHYLPENHVYVAFDNIGFYNSHMNNFKNIITDHFKTNIERTIPMYHPKKDAASDQRFDVKIQDYGDEIFGFTNNDGTLIYTNYSDDSHFANVLIPCYREPKTETITCDLTLENEWKQIEQPLRAILENYNINFEELIIESKYPIDYLTGAMDAIIKEVSESRKQ